MMLSNTLADLAERVKEASIASATAEKASIEQALEAGRLLVEAKDECAHGQWLPFLKRADVHERQARRLMQLARSGLKADTVSDLGGIKATLRWLQGLALPKAGEVLLVALDGFSEEYREPMCFVWPEAGGYHVASVDVNEASPHAVMTVRPVLDETAVYLTIYQSLDMRIEEMSFQVVPEMVAGNHEFGPIRDQVAQWRAGHA